MSDHGTDEATHRSFVHPRPDQQYSLPTHVQSPYKDGHKETERALPSFMQAANNMVVSTTMSLKAVYSYHVAALSIPPPSRWFASSGRLFCVVMYVLMILIVAVSILNLFLIYTDDPLEFEIRSFTMTDFNKNSTRVVQAKWKVNVAVRNPNMKLRVDLNGMELTLTYDRRSNMDTFQANDFSVPKKRETILHGNFKVPSVHPRHNTTIPPKWLRDVRVENGTLGLEINAVARFRAGGFVVDVFNVSSSCFPMPVNFRTVPDEWSWSGRLPCVTKNYNFFKDIF